MIHFKSRYKTGFQPSRLQTCLRSTFLVLTTLGVVGCSGLPANLAADGGIRIERHDSRQAHIGPVQARADTEGLRISGTLDKKFLQRGRIPGHLHIETQTAEGSVLSQDTARYHRHQVKSGRAHFSITLKVQPETVHSVKVQHHGLNYRCG